eukprot:2017949-Prymnesium_polylepis.2
MPPLFLSNEISRCTGLPGPPPPQSTMPRAAAPQRKPTRPRASPAIAIASNLSVDEASSSVAVSTLDSVSPSAPCAESVAAEAAAAAATLAASSASTRERIGAVAAARRRQVGQRAEDLGLGDVAAAVELDDVHLCDAGTAREQRGNSALERRAGSKVGDHSPMHVGVISQGHVGFFFNVPTRLVDAVAVDPDVVGADSPCNGARGAAAVVGNAVGRVAQLERRGADEMHVARVDDLRRARC